MCPIIFFVLKYVTLLIDFSQSSYNLKWRIQKMKNRIYLLLMAVILLVNVTYGKELTGTVFSGTVKSSKSGKTWPAILKIVSYNQTTGSLEGELHWSNLGSIHKIAGQLSGSRLAFKETEYIKKGGALLNCEYDALFSNNEISGSWTDLKSDKGTFQLIKKEEISGDNGKTNEFANAVFTGSVKSSNSGKTYPAILKIISFNPDSGSWEGELEWTSLRAVHKAVGQLSGTHLTFKETEYIKKGGANLNCEYDGSFSNNVLSGVYSDPKSDKGTFTLKKD